MPDLRKKVRGRIYKVDEKALLLLDDGAATCYLAFALVEKGTDVEIFPESLLDDWGHELNSMALYEWIQDNAIHFPRAEVFGHDGDGRTTQAFLRDLDPLAKFPCYVFEEHRQAIADGIQVVAIGVLEGDGEQPVRTMQPLGTESPLNNAKIHWWRVGHRCSPDSILATIEV